MESDASELKMASRPSSEEELGRFPDRLREAIGGESIRAFAARCGLSDTVLRQYLAGKSEPTRMALIAIARAADVTLEWLAIGRGKKEGEWKRMDVSTIHDALRARIRQMSGNPFQRIAIGSETGLTPDLVREYVQGEFFPSDEQLREIAKRAKFANVEKLFVKPGEEAIAHLHINAEAYVQVPRYEVSASAGGGAIIHSEQIVDYLSFKADWIHNALGIAVKDLALINVKGDSMEPSLSNEDLILIDLRTRRVEDNAIYVLQFNGSLLVKRIQRKMDGTVIIKSDNQVYEPEVLKGEAVDQLKVVGRVVWCGRRM